MSSGLRWPIAALFSALALSALVLSNSHGPLRLLVTLWFLLVCTGMAFVPLLRIPSLSTELAVGVVTSIAIDALVATALVLAGALSTESGLIALLTVCLLGCALQARAWVISGRELT